MALGFLNHQQYQWPCFSRGTFFINAFLILRDFHFVPRHVRFLDWTSLASVKWVHICMYLYVCLYACMYACMCRMCILGMQLELHNSHTNMTHDIYIPVSGWIIIHQAGFSGKKGIFMVPNYWLPNSWTLPILKNIVPILQSIVTPQPSNTYQYIIYTTSIKILLSMTMVYDIYGPSKPPPRNWQPLFVSKSYTPWKLTWHWKIPMFQKEIHLKFMVDFPFSLASFHWGPKIFCSSPLPSTRFSASPTSSAAPASGKGST